LNFLDGLLLAAFGLAVADGARRGLSPYLAEFVTFIASLGVAFAVFAPVALVTSRVLQVPASAAGLGVFLVAVVVAHGLAWPSLHRWAAAAERRLPYAAARRLGMVPAFGVALLAATVILGGVAALPGAGGLQTLVRGSAIGSSLTRAAAVLPMHSLIGTEPSQGQMTLNGRQGDEENAFYKLSFPPGLKPEVDAAAEQRMLSLVNAERRRESLRPLKMDPQLQAVARAHSRDMYLRAYFSHVTPDGRSAFDRLEAAGVKFLAAGENIAFAPDVDAAEQSLISSPEHRANILAPDYVRIGIGVLRAAGYQEMFTQEFADAG
jgi:uncharacterized protein YkwD